MVLDNGMFRPKIDENSPPVDISTAITPPEESEMNVQQGEEVSKATQQNRRDLANYLRPGPIRHFHPGNHFARILRRTPTATIVLDGTLRVAEVSDSHLSFSRLNREQLLHTSVYDLPPSAVPAPSIVSLSGALSIAIRTRDVQMIDIFQLAERDDFYSLRLTPIFEDVLIYVLLESQRITPGKPNPNRSPEAYIS